VAVTDDGRVWWEGIGGPPPGRLTDWQGRPWTPSADAKAAHPNPRFTTPATNNLFGGRRARTVPLVYGAFNWQHGVYLGATMASETTAAATGAVGVVRRDPMAMLPFCGYNMADYWGHWLRVGAGVSNPPRVFQVNWFQKDEAGRFIWPGFGQNMRVLRWVRDVVRGEAGADLRETPIGLMPTRQALGCDELGLSDSQVDLLLGVDREAWRREADDHAEFFACFGERLPQEMRDELQALKQRLGS
jgi:phosphoenolpyruvate carboxykinase (GTP)